MKVRRVNFEKAGHLTELCQEYISNNPDLKNFYNNRPELKAFGNQINEKSSFPKEKREILVSELQKQYKDLDLSETVASNLSKLSDANTFTVTTGHQLNIFTGPLFFIYKIVSTINMARELTNKYPEKNFVPVYWMGSEDHDFEEISHFRLYGEKYQWETNQTGAVGEFDPKSLVELAKKMPGKNDIFIRAYKDFSTLADSVRFYVNELFGKYGLVIVDSNTRSLKREFTEVISKDIFKAVPLKQVEESNSALEKLGYSTQVYARNINFFYHEKGIRARLEEDKGKYNVVDTELSFTKDEILEKIEKTPEQFSPNVILRPLYQETILPNLAYIGGPSEVAYWLQLKEVFDSFETPFPILIPRNFAVVVPGHIDRKMQKSGLSEEDLFRDENQLIKEYTLKNSEEKLTIEEKEKDVAGLYELIKEQAEKIDPTLGPMVAGFAKKSSNGLEKIQKKMIRAQKRKLSDKTRQISEVLEYTRPDGTPQERKDNFLNFYHTDPAFIDKLVAIFDPFDFSYLVLRNE